MIRTFCDCCGKEMNDQNTPTYNGCSTGRLRATVQSANRTCDLGVEVITSRDGIGNAGDFCKYCVIDALRAFDDRPCVVAG